MGSRRFASVLVDEALAAALVPWPCPCPFGPQGRYRLEELISTGPRSLVYRATDQKLSSQGFDARVAVKVFRVGAAPNEEALAARRITHPNVLSILDGGVEDGSQYLVAEFVDGGDLSGKGGPWPAREAAQFMAKVARGVQAAHSAGIVHCDLKPANILLTDAGEPKLADFELSRWSDRDDSQARGNAAFMSPEQFRGEPDSLTPPSDIYALGGLLYWLLTGRLPNGGTEEEVAQRLTRKGAAPSPLIERDLDRICMRAMAPPRDARYHSAGEFADDLARWLGFEPLPWDTTAARRLWLSARRHPVRWGLLFAGLVAGASVLGAWQFSAAVARSQRAKAQEDSVRMAHELVEQTRAKVRRQIEFMARTTLSSTATDLQDRVLPALVWMTWLTDLPVINASGDVPEVAERAGMLRAMVTSSEGAGRRGDLEDVLARYALAYFLVEQGEFAEARSFTAQVEELWRPRFAQSDPFWVSVSGIEQSAAAGEKAAAGRAAEAITELNALVSRLENDGRAEPVRRLAERLLGRLRKDHPK